MDIPYIGTVYYKNTNATKQIGGTYKGVDYYYLVNEI